MDKIQLAIAVASSLFMVEVAEATTVTETFAGTITGANSADTNGLFGPPGADLTGQTVNIKVRYETSLLPNMQNCRINPTSCSYDSSQVGDPRAVSSSIKIAGKTVSYSSTIYGDVVFDNGYQNRFVPEINVFSGQSQGGQGYAVNVSFKAPVVFGKQLAPGNRPVANRINVMSFFKEGDTYASEVLTFVVTRARR